MGCAGQRMYSCLFGTLPHLLGHNLPKVISEVLEAARGETASALRCCLMPLDLLRASSPGKPALPSVSSSAPALPSVTCLWANDLSLLHSSQLALSSTRAPSSTLDLFHRFSQLPGQTDMKQAFMCMLPGKVPWRRKWWETRVSR